MRGMAKLLTLVALGGCLASPARGETLEVNLANMEPGGSVTVTVAHSSEYVVVVTNRIPGKSYSISYLKRVIPIPALPSMPAPPPTLETTACGALSIAVNKLNGTDTEASVPNLIKGVESAKGKVKPGDCRDEIAEADQQLRATRSESDEHFTIGAGEELRVTVERTQNSKILKWEKVFSGGPRGEWLVSYGFTFIPNDDERWFSKTTTEPKQFVITKKADRQNYDFAPSIFFIWLPASMANRNSSYGPTAGLGFDLSNPVVFLGGCYGWNQNIHLVGGVVAHQVQRLSGEFQRGQTIGENLASDKLTEKTYRASYFLGVSFRFGSNPFKSGDAKVKKPEGPKKPPS